MKSGPAKAMMMATVLMAAQVAVAHPGHVHTPGPVHGYSWIDLVGFLVASLALPAAVWFGAWVKRRRSGRD
jgi:hypothetical protein